MSDLRATGSKILKFAAGGAVSSGVTIGVTALLHEQAGVDESIAAAAGLVSAMIVNFIVLRHLVFASHAMPIMAQLTRFLASSGVFRGLEYLGFLLVNGVFGTQYVLALIIVLGLSFILKFIVYERFVFSRNAPIQEKPQ